MLCPTTSQEDVQHLDRPAAGILQILLSLPEATISTQGAMLYLLLGLLLLAETNRTTAGCLL